MTMTDAIVKRADSHSMLEIESLYLNSSDGLWNQLWLSHKRKFVVVDRTSRRGSRHPRVACAGGGGARQITQVQFALQCRRSPHTPVPFPTGRRRRVGAIDADNDVDEWKGCDGLCRRLCPTCPSSLALLEAANEGSRHVRSNGRRDRRGKEGEARRVEPALAETASSRRHGSDDATHGRGLAGAEGDREGRAGSLRRRNSSRDPKTLRNCGIWRRRTATGRAADKVQGRRCSTTGICCRIQRLLSTIV
jgi:hypothetical protein